MVNAAQAEDSSDVIMGNLPVNDVPAKVLFDTGASHCFISRPFASKHAFVTQVLPKPLAIVSPARQMTSRVCVPDVTITLGDISSCPLQMFLVTRILILFSEWIGFLSTRLSLIVLPGRFN